MIPSLDIPPEQQRQEIADSRHIAMHRVRIDGCESFLEIAKYMSRIIAVSDMLPERMIGYGDLSFEPAYGDLISHAHDAEELNFLVVEPGYFGNGIGSIILQTAFDVARRDGKRKFLVSPERPGRVEVERGLLSESERDHRFPYSTEELRGFYRRFGFRELNDKEFRHYFSYMNAFCPSGAPMHAKVPTPEVPAPVFGDGLVDRVLKSLSERENSWLQPWVSSHVHKRIPWDQYRAAKKEWEKLKVVSCENYRYVKGYMIKEL